MKTFIFLASLLFTIAHLQAQDYHINFTGSGESSTVDSVHVLNLTQGTSLTLKGSDILHLYGSLEINSIFDNENRLQIYPNPMNEASKIEFYNSQTGQVSIEIFDVTGRVISTFEKQILQGYNIFEISGLNAGVYIVNISTAEWKYAGNLISTGWNSDTPTIKYVGSDLLLKSIRPLKSLKNLVQMQYIDGERLLFKGISGNYSRVLTVIPANSQTINFEFVTCTDLDNNHYAVVTIGTQTWMAENLAYLPSVSPSSSGSDTISFYYVHGYQGTNVTSARATGNYQTYGVLYNWPAAMNGEPSSNSVPSGVQGVCPLGWHLPGDYEWDVIANYLGGSSGAGGKMKETDTTHWYSPNTGATNASGFSALPGGFRSNNGNFGYVRTYGYWWSSTESDALNAWFRFTYTINGHLGRSFLNKRTGFSVRCLMD